MRWLASIAIAGCLIGGLGAGQACGSPTAAEQKGADDAYSRQRVEQYRSIWAPIDELILAGRYDEAKALLEANEQSADRNIRLENWIRRYLVGENKEKQWFGLEALDDIDHQPPVPSTIADRWLRVIARAGEHAADFAEWKAKIQDCSLLEYFCPKVNFSWQDTEPGAVVLAGIPPEIVAENARAAAALAEEQRQAAERKQQEAAEQARLLEVEHSKLSYRMGVWWETVKSYVLLVPIWLWLIAVVGVIGWSMHDSVLGWLANRREEKRRLREEAGFYGGGVTVAPAGTLVLKQHVGIWGWIKRVVWLSGAVAVISAIWAAGPAAKAFIDRTSALFPMIEQLQPMLEKLKPFLS